MSSATDRKMVAAIIDFMEANPQGDGDGAGAAALRAVLADAEELERLRAFVEAGAVLIEDAVTAIRNDWTDPRSDCRDALKACAAIRAAAREKKGATE